jgi:hypothetical protein
VIDCLKLQKEGLEKLLRRTDYFDEWWSSQDNNDTVTATVIKEEAPVITPATPKQHLIVNPMIVFKTTFAYQIRKYKCKFVLL